MSDVFICHVEEDAEVALDVALGLEEAGYTTWCYELDSIPGASYLIQTGRAIEHSKAFILVISPHSLGSNQVTKEVVRAHESGKHFIPVLRDVSHAEFQNRQPEWREAIGAATSIRIPQEGAIGILDRIIDGLKALEIHPRAKPDTKRTEIIRKALSELTSRVISGEIVEPVPHAEVARDAGNVKRIKRPLLIALALAAIVAIIVVPVIVLDNGNEKQGDSSGTVTPTPKVTPTLQGETIVVSNTADSGPGSLRQALLDAESGDTITFDTAVFLPSAPATIYLYSALPPITQGNQTIDASNAGAILDGTKITTPQPVDGLSISSNSNTIRGLQIVGFSDAGIALHSGASYNVIGGDRGIGARPLGQGNLISGNGNFGIGLWDEGTSHNTIQGNYIGIKLDGTATWGHSRDGIHSNGANYNLITGNVIGGSDSAGVYLCCVTDGRNTVTANIIGTDESGENALSNFVGVLIDRTSYNVIGPGNIIACNISQGIMLWEDTAYNTVTQNSIHNNGGAGIEVSAGGNTELTAPLIFDFDLSAGTLSGNACANCTIEVFSDGSDEGEVYEGRATADGAGDFTFDKGAPFTGPHLKATATDADGNTSEFSAPTL